MQCSVRSRPVREIGRIGVVLQIHDRHIPTRRNPGEGTAERDDGNTAARQGSPEERASPHCGIVHGDLTTSNVIVTKRSRLVLIDFGLAEYSRELESRGVDLVLGQRVFHSTHHGYGAECYQALLEGYRERVGNVEADEVEERVKEITRRGRYAIER
ncbi:Kae1-associated serine/threonine protein kinase [Candidatus Bathyarchaeota archaeon]|nr:Kae1-associated serine/threonine protein kinase [Candidatus Bathyarchaeota archaeon]